MMTEFLYLAVKKRITVSPNVGHTFGGYRISLVGLCLNKQVNVMFRFDGEHKVVGEKQNDIAVSCIVPTIGRTGQVKMEVSLDGGATYIASSTYFLSKAAS